MKLEVTKNRLLKAISKSEKITGKNLTLPVLNCLLLKAEKNNLKITATNLDLGIEVNIPAQVEEEGVVAVPGSILNSLVSGDYKSEKVVLEVIDDNLHINTESNSATIKSLENKDFPTIPRLEKDNTFKINSKKLIKGLKSVWYSSSTSNIKPELSSVLIYNENNKLVFVATDSFRLAEKKVDVDNIGDFEQILLPFKNIPEIIRIFDDIDDDINIYLTKNQIAFEYNSIYLTSRVIDGTFPDYQQLLPKEATTEITLLKEDFLNSLKISNIFSDKFNKIIFKVDPEEKTFETSSKNNDIGENKTKVDCVINGEGLEISFNQKYITDCFQSVDTDSLVLKFNGLNKPMVIKTVPETQFTYLVMPMNK